MLTLNATILYFLLDFSSNPRPYPYQTWTLLLTAVLVASAGMIAYGLYKLTIRGMGVAAKKIFHSILMAIGGLLAVLFFSGILVSVLTIHSVNRQLGFSYATPERPEGEIFEITKVIPGGVMNQAGLKQHDHVQLNDVNEFYNYLIQNQGNEISFTIKRNNELVNIVLIVPKLKLPFRGLTFLL